MTELEPRNDEPAEPNANPFVSMSRRQRIAIVIAYTSCLVLVAFARSYDPTPTDDWIFPLLALYIGVLSAPFVVLRSSLGWFHPVVFVSLMGFVAVIQRFKLYAWGIDWHQALPHGREELSELIEFQLVLYSLALASFYAGYFMAPRLPLPRLRLVDAPPGLVRRIVIFNLLSVAAFLVFVAARGGLDAHIAGWARGRHSEFRGMHYQAALMGFGGIACWLWLAYRRSAVWSGVFWGAVIVSTVIAFLVMGSRSSAIYPIFVGMMIWMLRTRRVAYGPMIFGVLAAIYAVGVLGTFRRSGWEGTASWETATESGVVDTIRGSAEGEITSRATTSDTSLAIYARVPDDVPLLWGSSYLATATLPIPRALWSSKPRQIGGIAGTVFFGQKAAGAPPGAVGEAYWNLHIPGVGVVFFLFGIFCNWIGRTYRRHAGQPAAIVMYASTLFTFSSPSTAAFTQWAIAFATLLIVLVGTGAMRLGRPSPAPWRRPAMKF